MLKFATLSSAIACLFYSMSCLYVGATRSLSFYNLKKENAENGGQIANTENSLISLKTALSIPVIATGSLLIAYLSVINKLDFVNALLSWYFNFLGVLVLKKYLYAYSQMNSALANFDFHIEALR